MENIVYVNTLNRYRYLTCPVRNDAPLELSFNFKKLTYWWCFNSNDIITLENLIDEITYLNAYLIIDFSQDPIGISDFKDFLNSTPKVKNVPKDKIIIISPRFTRSFYDLSQYTLNMVVPLIKSEYTYKHIFFNSLFRLTKFQYTKHEKGKEPVPPPKKKNPEKHFLCLSYRDAIPRQIINSLFHKHGLFENNLITHNRVKEGKVEDDIVIFNRVKGIFGFTDSFNLKTFLRWGFLKHTIDTPEDKINATHSYKLHHDLSTKVCFEIVHETCITQNNIFITEKTLKAILSKNVFFIVGNPFSLVWLKKLGFKTFSDIIDESYDDERNFHERSLLIMKEVRRLCSLSVGSLHEKLSSLDNILDYNYNHLLNNEWDFDISHNIESHLDGYNDKKF